MESFKFSPADCNLKISCDVCTMKGSCTINQNRLKNSLTDHGDPVEELDIQLAHIGIQIVNNIGIIQGMIGKDDCLKRIEYANIVDEMLELSFMMTSKDKTIVPSDISKLCEIERRILRIAQ